MTCLILSERRTCTGRRGSLSIDVSLLKPFKNKHKGEDVVIFANGKTLNDCRLEEIPGHVRTIGLNASWSKFWADYHVVADRHQQERERNLYDEAVANGWLPTQCKGPEAYKQMGREGRLFAYGVWPDEFKAFLMPRMTKFTRPGQQTALAFSRDISEGAQMGIAGFGAVSYLGLQVAVTMGFARIFWMGLDLGLGGAHFHKWWPADESRMVRQVALMDYAEKDSLGPLEIRTYIVNSPNSNCTTWPRISWKEFLAMTAKEA